jgi:hypothetical protein
MAQNMTQNIAQNVAQNIVQNKMMTIEEYIETRLCDQIEWYDRKSLENQKKFKIYRTAEIIAAALIPFLSGISINMPKLSLIGTIIVGILGTAVTIIASILGLGKHQENWAEYRTTCESLKKERFLFQTGVEPYNTEDAFRLLVQRVETLISKENTNWAQYMMNPEQGKERGKS